MERSEVIPVQLDGLMRWRGMKRLLMVALIVLLLFPPVQALEMLSGDDLLIDTPVADDVFAAGGTITINAPVDSLVVAGGEIILNAPVNGDVFAAGGRIAVNGDVGGKIVAAGGELELRGKATNAVLAGGSVTLHPTAVITRDAVISGSMVSNAGTVTRNLIVRAEEFQNTGTSGYLDYVKSEGRQGLQEAFTLVHLLLILGFFILGILVLKLFPALFPSVDEEVRRSPVKYTLVGFALLIASVILIFILAITVVGLPLAAVLGLLMLIALMLASLFVSFALGRTLLGLLKLQTSELIFFIIGFILLSLLFQLPYVGWLIRLLALSLGVGAIFYFVRNNWPRITAPSG
jgi:hypothetical protein